MSEMIERVAKAIFAANRPDICQQHRDEIWRDPRAEGVRNVARDLAQAAIEAMTVPTATMREAGGAPADTTWHLMINAALA